jgi:hypothetical protein
LLPQASLFKNDASILPAVINNGSDDGALAFEAEFSLVLNG